jgi:membrane dipeptidase
MSRPLAVQFALFLTGMASLLCGCERTILFQASERTWAVHGPAIVVDLQTNTLVYASSVGYDLSRRHRFRPRGTNPLFTHFDFPRAREGGLDGVFFAFIAHPLREVPGRNYPVVMDLFETLDRVLRENADSVALAGAADDIVRISQEGKLAILVGLQGGHMLDDNLDHLREYHRRGARYLGLVHHKTHDWAAADNDVAQGDPGLGPFGREVVRECNRLGIMVDLAHASPRTFWDTLAVAQAPVIVSHTACAELWSHPRNLTDEQIRAVAQTRGVIGIILHSEHLVPKGSAQLSDVVAHLEHVIQVAGLDSVALGSDFDGFTSAPAGLRDVSQYPNLTTQLLERGYSKQDIGKILGGNVLRVMREVQAKAKELNGK